MIEEVKEIKRSKNIIQNVLTAKHIYQYYIKDYEIDSKFYTDYTTFKGVCSDFNKDVSDRIINDGYFFKMPYRLGTLRIRKRKIKLNNLKHNYGLYNESNGKYKNSFLNEHSGNYYVRFYWNKIKETIIKNKTPYTFIPTRDNKRNLAKSIKEEGILQINKYFE